MPEQTWTAEQIRRAVRAQYLDFIAGEPGDFDDAADAESFASEVLERLTATGGSTDG